MNSLKLFLCYGVWTFSNFSGLASSACNAFNSYWYTLLNYYLSAIITLISLWISSLCFYLTLISKSLIEFKIFVALISESCRNYWFILITKSQRISQNILSSWWKYSNGRFWTIKELLLFVIFVIETVLNVLRAV